MQNRGAQPVAAFMSVGVDRGRVQRRGRKFVHACTCSPLPP